VRRLAPLALLLASIALAACASAERPEGVVERWLLSLNQGSAGEPARYAPGRVSELVMPGWDELEPGELDVIEVGRGRGTGRAEVPWSAEVPFRVVTIAGAETAGVAFVGDPGTRPAIRGVELGDDPALPLPSEGGPDLDEDDGGAWLAALGVAAALILLTVGLMRLAPGPEAQTGSSG
jgi:hypothetical protein